MAFFKTFYDMAGSTSYTTHTIGSFDANCSSGGGSFRFVGNVSNASITNIPGIRIKPTNSTVGYWERVWDGPMNVGWFGCQNTTSTPSTFATLGVSQTTLDSRYGVGFATTSDNYDTTAIRYALKFMENLGNQSLIFEPKTYWLTRACDLPVNIVGGKTGRGMFIIDGNGATIVKANTLQFNFFQRIPVQGSYISVNAAVAAIYIDNGFTFTNFNSNGSGGVWQNSGYSFLHLGATFGSIVQNIFLTNFDIGLRLEFCMNATINNIFVNNATSYSVLTRTGSWVGAALANASSNMVEISHIRVFDTNNQIAGVALLNSDTSVISQIIVEGTGVPQYGVLWDSMNSSVAPNGTIQHCHIECYTSRGAIYVKPRSGTKIYVSDIYLQYPQNVIGLEAPNFPSASYPIVVVDRIPYWPPGSKFLNIGTGNKWQISDAIINAYLTTNTQVLTPASTSTVSSASGTAGVMTYTTSAPHAFVAGQRVTVTGLTPIEYNVTDGLITGVGSSTFTVSGPGTTASSGTGTAVGGCLWDTTTTNGTIPTPSSRLNWTAPWGI
jgi:hypothetical protein